MYSNVTYDVQIGTKTTQIDKNKVLKVKHPLCLA